MIRTTDNSIWRHRLQHGEGLRLCVTHGTMSELSQASASSLDERSTACPRCGSHDSVRGRETTWHVYLRCVVCYEIWALPDRRQFPRRRLGVPARRKTD
jgi:hypothetical protein